MHLMQGTLCNHQFLIFEGKGTFLKLSNQASSSDKHTWIVQVPRLITEIRAGLQNRELKLIHTSVSKL